MTDVAVPIVVDSPLPSAAADTAVIESLLDSPAASIPSTPVLDGVEPPIEDELVVAAPVVDDSADRIKGIGEAVGYDLSRFKTVEAAEAAADMVFERFAQMGGTGDIAAALRPPGAKEPAAVEPEDLGLDEAEVTPTVLAAMKKLNAQNAELRKKFAENEASTQVQQVQNVVKAFEQKAESFLDGLDAPVFGKAGQRTTAQAVAAEVVGKVAGRLLVGMITEARQNGRTALPPIERIMAQAVKMAGFPVDKKSAAAAPIAKAYTLAPKTPAAGGGGSAAMPRVAAGNDPNNIFTSKDPTIQGIWAETMRRIGG